LTYLLDTNVLLRAREPSSSQRQACVDLLNRSRKPVCEVVLATQTLIEYWVVATRPLSANGLGLDPAQARNDIDDYLALYPSLLEPPDVLNRWRILVAKFSVSGRPAHDARLVAVMDAYSLTKLISWNVTDFARYSHIDCLSPAQWLAANPIVP
jgi:predicted nucleic acid-binding protein